ncbi:ATP-binding cassette domain-containing protein [Bremerella sp. JC817]|uniref:ABC transporter ATP-binding protein n=1 Tax=Bremerella sp. JC817 TaxID=3231756 RepID=UPI00345A6EDF
MESSAAPTIQFQDTGRIFAGAWALRQVNASLLPGSVYAVLGANGAGKSTLLRLVAGWLPASEGRIYLGPSPMRPTAIHLRRKVMLLDDTSGDRQATLSSPVDDLCQLVRDYHADRPGIEDEIANWFERLRLVPVSRSKRGEMSKGQAYKITMVGLFAIAPPIWLLDEPFSAGLDAEGLQILEKQIREHAHRGGTVIFSSQWPEHARRLADGALVLHEGNLVWSGVPDEKPNDELTDTAAPALQAVLQGLGPS